PFTLTLPRALCIPPPPTSPLFPYTTLFRSLRPNLCSCAQALAQLSRAICATVLKSLHKSEGRIVHRASYRRMNVGPPTQLAVQQDRKSTRLNSSHGSISYAVLCLKKKKLEI